MHFVVGRVNATQWQLYCKQHRFFTIFKTEEKKFCNVKYEIKMPYDRIGHFSSYKITL